MKILVTGGAGFIGSHTCVELINAGHKVIIVDNFSNSNKEVFNGICKITGVKRVDWHNVDLRHFTIMDKLLNQLGKIDCVIHFAGLKSVNESIKDPKKYYDNNIDSTLNLLWLMESFKINKLIFSSSATVYSSDNEMPVTEESKIGNCTNPYGWTKYMQEQILRDYAKSNPEFSVIQLRYFNPIGAHPSGLIGENPQGLPNNLMPYIVRVASKKYDHLSIFGNDYNTIDGTGVRDYIHVVDLAKGHVAALNYFGKFSGEEIFNLGTGTGYSVLEVVNTFETINDVEVPCVIEKRRSGDLPEVYSSSDKANRLLNWKAELNLEDMCRDAWNYELKYNYKEN